MTFDTTADDDPNEEVDPRPELLPTDLVDIPSGAEHL